MNLAHERGRGEGVELFENIKKREPMLTEADIGILNIIY